MTEKPGNRPTLFIISERSKEIGWRAGGSFWIASGDALIGVDADDASARQRALPDHMSRPMYLLEDRRTIEPLV
jgi:hypothetical protein